MKPEASISLFLRELKVFVEKNGFIFVEREASRQFLADRNMTQDELKEVILGLEVKDCFDGPEPDRDLRYQYWTVAEFSPTHCGEKLYLQLSIKIDIERVKVLSVKLYTERGGESR